MISDLMQSDGMDDGSIQSPWQSTNKLCMAAVPCAGSLLMEMTKPQETLQGFNETCETTPGTYLLTTCVVHVVVCRQSDVVRTNVLYIVILQLVLYISGAQFYFAFCKGTN